MKENVNVKESAKGKGNVKEKESGIVNAQAELLETGREKENPRKKLSGTAKWRRRKRISEKWSARRLRKRRTTVHAWRTGKEEKPRSYQNMKKKRKRYK